MNASIIIIINFLILGITAYYDYKYMEAPLILFIILLVIDALFGHFTFTFYSLLAILLLIILCVSKTIRLADAIVYFSLLMISDKTIFILLGSILSAHIYMRLTGNDLEKLKY
jgi:uncharacterized membrane protein